MDDGELSQTSNEQTMEGQQRNGEKYQNTSSEISDTQDQNEVTEGHIQGDD